MPIDINALRPERGGDPEKWREYCRKRFKSPELVDNVVELDKVSGWANEYKREPGNLNFFFPARNRVRMFIEESIILIVFA